ncbi:MAG: hypothetical protein ACRDYC_06705, partial [Acidimicrobiales bacterium]
AAAGAEAGAGGVPPADAGAGAAPEGPSPNDVSPSEESPAAGGLGDADLEAFWAASASAGAKKGFALRRHARRRDAGAPADARGFGPRATACLAALAVGMGALTVGADLHSRRVTQEILSPDTQATQLTAAVLPFLTPQEHWIKVVIKGQDSWPPVAGVVLDLTRRGYRVSVEPTAGFGMYFGTAKPPAGDTNVPLIGFFPANTPPAQLTGGVVADVDGLLATYLRPNA